MQFKQGTHVFTSDGKNIGSIDRVVLDPKTDEVIDLVVRQGWLLSEDKVVPIGLVETATEDRVTLYEAEHNLPTLPKFEETYCIPVDELERQGKRVTSTEDYAASMYGYPPIGVAWWAHRTTAGYPAVALGPEYTERVQENIPEGSVAVKAGARVLSLEGDHIGNVEDVFIDAATHRATHVVISQGLVFKERKLIPTNWIKRAGEDDLTLTVNRETVHKLPRYNG